MSAYCHGRVAYQDRPASGYPTRDPELADAPSRAELERNLYCEALAGAQRMRRINQPDAATWHDCDLANADPIELRYTVGQAWDRQYRAERDLADGRRGPYRPDDQPWPILTVARHRHLPDHDCYATSSCRVAAEHRA